MPAVVRTSEATVLDTAARKLRAAIRRIKSCHAQSLSLLRHSTRRPRSRTGYDSRAGGHSRGSRHDMPIVAQDWVIDHGKRMASEWQVVLWLDSRLVPQKNLQRDSCLFDLRRRIT
jgi:hypothetical protein